MNYGECQALIVFGQILKKGRTHYIKPRPKIMLELLEKYHNRKISDKTYWRNARGLEDQGLITRRARWNTTDRKNPHRQASIICLTIEGAKRLYNLGCAWAGQIMGAMIKWAKKGDERPPQYDEEEKKRQKTYEEALRDIRERAQRCAVRENELKSIEEEENCLGIGKLKYIE